ncbi:MAG: ATP-binding protein [Chlorobi bacterium]|nr:ATP-binding protein [Chlorobiota bacterium]
MIVRELEKIILGRIGKKKAILILGARQVGKTTLVKKIVDDLDVNYLWLNGDEIDTRDKLTNATSTQLKNLFGKNQIIVIDEAQRISNIGLTIKIAVDYFPEKQLIITGSSSFELSNILNEPLTGRKYEYNLFPLSFGEMVNHHGLTDEKRLFENRLIYGYYPDVINNPGDEIEHLNLITDSYLFKDILNWEKINKPVLLEKLVQALALQIGSEIKYNEIAQLIGADPVTVEKYIDLLERIFVVFRLTSLSRNMRNEIKKGKKIYFYDNGVRNALIKNFNPLSIRQDKGALMENYIVSERVKRNHYKRNFVNAFFWRTVAKQEIDYIEEQNGVLTATEIKWNPKAKWKTPKAFLTAYPGSKINFIHKDNFEEFLL